MISVSFDPDNKAYAALTALKELDAQGRLDVEAAAVVARDDDGQIVVKDRVGSFEYAGAAGGGLLGLLVGIIGGPLGVLIGGSYGLLVGSLFDLGEEEQSESVLGQISASVKPGHTALLAEVTEQSPEVVDTAMARLGGTVLRRPVAEVEAEIAAAEQAQREAKREATKELVAEAPAHQGAGPRQGRAAQGEAAAPREGGERIARDTVTSPTDDAATAGLSGAGPWRRAPRLPAMLRDPRAYAAEGRSAASRLPLVVEQKRPYQKTPRQDARRNGDTEA